MVISGDVTDAGRTYGQTREDRATQPKDRWRLSLAKVYHILGLSVFVYLYLCICICEFVFLYLR